MPQRYKSFKNTSHSSITKFSKFSLILVYLIKLLTNLNPENLKNKSNLEGRTLFAYKKKSKPRLFSTITRYHCKSSDGEGIYMRPEMKVCFAVRKILFIIIFIAGEMK